MAADHKTQTHKKQAKTVPQYEADEGALSNTQLKQIKKLAPQRKNLLIRTSLIE